MRTLPLPVACRRPRRADSTAGQFFGMSPAEQRERVIALARAKFSFALIARLTGWTVRDLVRLEIEITEQYEHQHLVEQHAVSA